MTEAAVFDLDDTLFAERDYVKSGFGAVGAYLSASWGIKTAEMELLADFARGERKGAFDRLLHRHGLGAELLPELVDRYREHRPRIALRAGFAKLLDQLRRTRAIGVLTDGPLSSQRQKIAVLELARRVDIVWINDELGPEHWKPSPSGFERMELLLANVAGRLATSYCYIGDNPAKDFAAPRRRGWFTVELRLESRLDPRPAPPGPEYEAEQEVRDIQSLARLLRSRP